MRGEDGEPVRRFQLAYHIPTAEQLKAARIGEVMDKDILAYLVFYGEDRETGNGSGRVPIFLPDPRYVDPEAYQNTRTVIRTILREYVEVSGKEKDGSFEE